MALGGLLLAYVVYPLHQWWRQSAALPVLKAHGAEFPTYNSWDPEKPEYHWCKTVKFNDGLSKDPQLRASLRSLPRLERLIVSSSRAFPLIGDDLRFISELSSLKHLEIHGGKTITDNDLKLLANLKQLKELCCFGLTIDGTAFAHFGENSSLRRVQLFTCEQLSIEGARELGRLTKLESLSVSSSQFTSAHAQELAGLTELQHLGLGYNSLDDAAMPVIAKFKKLKTLGLQECQITDEGLKWIVGLGELTSLQLNGAKITDDGMRNLIGLRNLKSLSLAKTPIRGYGLKHLSLVKELQYLYLQQTDLAPDAIIELSRFPKLQQLVITGPTFGDEHMKFLPHFSSLFEIVLNGDELTDAGLVYLDRIPGQVHVSIRAKNATEEGMKKARSSGGYTFSNR